MRRELAGAMIALALCAAVGACRQSADERAQAATVRGRREAGVRETPTLERVTIPADSGRLIYDPPPDLAASSPGRKGVAINGVDTSTHRPDSARAPAP
jgi:hypothetical protein